MIHVEDIFVLPQGYVKAFAEYQDKKKAYDREVERLEGFRQTIVMKIQIGSNEVLNKLIAQVDNMADLNIINNQFLMIKKVDQIEDKSTEHPTRRRR
jgi:hypothetical protein